MPAQTRITVSEWVQELDACFERLNETDGLEPGTITTSEYAQAANVSNGTARRRLMALARDGRLKPERFRRTTLWGDKCNVPGYRIAVEKKK